MKTLGIELLLVVLLTLGTLGCGESGEPVGSDASVADDAGLRPTCGAPGRTGRTECATSLAGNCPSGQYCDNVMLTCSVGCTSDDNCGAAERCARAAGQAVGACEVCGACGDGTCQPPESAATCPADCATTACGDGACQPPESAATCPADCARAPTCGDGACQPSESAATCPADCARAPTCGDGACHPSESAATCPADCATTTCGDGTCHPSESAATCPADCGGRSSLEGCIAGCERAGACGAEVGLVDRCRADCGAFTEPERLAVAACDLTECQLVANCFGAECFTVSECSGGATCFNGGCCGNGVCGFTEAWSICPADCGDELLTECLGECEALGFFGCGETCGNDCRASTPPDRERFLACSAAAICNYERCSELL